MVHTVDRFLGWSVRLLVKFNNLTTLRNHIPYSEYSLRNITPLILGRQKMEKHTLFVGGIITTLVVAILVSYFLYVTEDDPLEENRLPAVKTAIQTPSTHEKTILRNGASNSIPTQPVKTEKSEKKIDDKVEPPVQSPGTVENQPKTTEPPAEHKFTRESAKHYLESILGAGNLDNPPDESKVLSLRNDGAYTDWMLQVDTLLGDKLTDQQKKALRDQQIKTIDTRNALRDDYLAGKLSWEQYIDSTVALAIWSDQPYSETIADDDYQKLFGFKKEEIYSMAENTLVPPEKVEIFNLFPGIKGNYSELSEEQLYERIPKSKIDQLSALKKWQMSQEVDLENQLENMPEKDVAQLLAQRTANFLVEVQNILSPEEYQFMKPALE